MKYKVGDRVYSIVFKEKGIIAHINFSDGARKYWIKPECRDSMYWVALSDQIKPIIRVKNV